MRKFQVELLENSNLNLGYNIPALTSFVIEENQLLTEQQTSSNALPTLLPNDFNFYYDDPSLYLTDVNALIAPNDADLTAGEFIPADPLFSSQWHLHNTSAGQFDINVTEVWDDYTGNGVRVIVFDNGFDYLHVDLDDNYNTVIDYDYSSNDFTPLPASSGDNHGTAVMGLIGAEQNTEGGVGVAYGVELVGYRGFALSASNADDQMLDAAGLGNGINNTNGNDLANAGDIISVSGGFGSNVFLGSTNIANAVAALETISEQGRDGLGTLYIKSSGNSRAALNSSSREEGVGEMMDSSKYSVNVAAMRQDGWVTDFSTPGANVVVSAFADNMNNNSAIVTTDRTGSSGYSSADHTTTFGGTSAAAPQVAGVVALMLEANADLGWRDVHSILTMSARHTGSEVGTAANTGAASNGGHEQATQLDGSSWFWNDASNWNGGGMHVSNDYGFGMVDALAAVRLAESWMLQSTSANDVTASQDMDGVNVTTALTSTFTSFASTETTDMIIEHVNLNLEFTADDLADLEIFVISPSGTRIQLLSDTGDTANFSGGDWDFGAVGFRGETSAGQWTVELRNDDGAAAGAITVTDVNLTFSGSAISDDDLFVFTNEYSDYAGVDGHVTSFVGGVGTDWLNAAAVTLAATIDMGAGTGTLDGEAITFSGIEGVYTGDGDDVITGSANADQIHTGRGNDSLGGGAGDDVLVGGFGDDMIDGGAGNDVAIYSGAQADYTVTDNGGGTYTVTDNVNSDGTDTVTNVETLQFSDGTQTLNTTAGPIDGTPGNDNLMGTAAADVINGLAGNDILNGLAGDDVINGGDGADRLIGGEGADALNGGAGFDSADYRGATSGVRFNVDTGGTFGEANGDTFSGLERYYLSDFNDIITGSDANEFFHGEDGNDTINAGGGIDRIYGGDGNDIQRGQGGNDLLFGSAGSDQLNGGIGFDIASYDNAASRVVLNLGSGGTLGDAAGDTYFGIEAVYGSDFNDILAGNNSSNELRGGDGDDILNGAGGNDRLFGGLGADALNGGTGTDIANYTQATESVTVDLVNGGANTGGTTNGYANGDTYSSIEWVFGSEFGDNISGDNANNRLEGRDGGDFIEGRGGNDRLLGGDGNDFIYGGDGVDTIFGQNGNDTLFGEAGNDFFFGSAGGDSMDGGADFDTVSYLASTTGVGISLASGGFSGDADGDSYISIERVLGSGSNDTIYGSSGNETLLGNGGNDNLSGLGGNDTLVGGAGIDTFVYFDSAADGGADVINDFNSNEFIEIISDAISDYNDLLAIASNAGGNVIFDFGGGNTLTLVGKNIADLASDDFSFIPASQEPLNDPGAFAAPALDELNAFAADIIDVFDMDALI